MYLRTVALMIASLLPFAAMAEVYSWKDASGKTHYGDRPPAARQADSRKLAAPPPADAEAHKAFTEKQMAEREKQQKAQDEAKKSGEDQSQAKQREENCLQARNNLSAIESGQIRFSIDAKGERTALDGAARDAEIARARQAADSWCKPLPKPAAK